MAKTRLTDAEYGRFRRIVDHNASRFTDAMYHGGSMDAAMAHLMTAIALNRDKPRLHAQLVKVYDRRYPTD